MTRAQSLYAEALKITDALLPGVEESTVESAPTSVEQIPTLLNNLDPIASYSRRQSLCGLSQGDFAPSSQ